MSMLSTKLVSNRRIRYAKRARVMKLWNFIIVCLMMLCLLISVFTRINFSSQLRRLNININFTFAANYLICNLNNFGLFLSSLRVYFGPALFIITRLCKNVWCVFTKRVEVATVHHVLFLLGSHTFVLKEFYLKLELRRLF